MSKEISEEKKQHLNKLNNARVQRYYGAHKLITFGAKIEESKYREIKGKLKETGTTQRQFIEEAIDEFLKRKN